MSAHASPGPSPAERDRPPGSAPAPDARSARLAADDASSCLLLTDVDGIIVHAGAGVATLLGYDPSELLGTPLASLQADPPGDGTGGGTAGTQPGATMPGNRYRRRDGGIVHALESVAAVSGGDGQPGLRLVVLHDVSAYHDAFERLRVSEERHRRLIEYAVEVLWTMSLDGQITYVSPAVEAYRGYTPEEAMAQTIDEILTPESQVTVVDYYTRLHTALAAGEPLPTFRGEQEYLCKDGSTVWSEVLCYPVVGPDGEFVELLGVTRDLSERKRYECELEAARDAAEAAAQALQAANQELERLSVTDPLTGAWNRRHFEREAELEMARACRHGELVSLLVIDIDHFKRVNDRFGHLVGDTVLVDVHRRLATALRVNDTLARWGGEEFVVVLPHSDYEAAVNTAERLRALVADEPFPVAGFVTVSVGVATYHGCEDFDAWMKMADDALYEAKAAGRNRVGVAA